MTTKAKESQSSSKAASEYRNANGEIIPDEAFENEAVARPMPLNEEQRKRFDEQTEALRKFKR